MTVRFDLHRPTFSSTLIRPTRLFRDGIEVRPLEDAQLIIKEQVEHLPAVYFGGVRQTDCDVWVDDYLRVRVRPEITRVFGDDAPYDEMGHLDWLGRRSTLRESIPRREPTPSLPRPPLETDEERHARHDREADENARQQPIWRTRKTIMWLCEHTLRHWWVQKGLFSQQCAICRGWRWWD